MDTKHEEGGKRSGALSWLRKAVMLSVAVILTAGAVGCHTVKGAGQDIESAGKTIEHSATK